MLLFRVVVRCCLHTCARIVGGRAFLLERARAQCGRDRVALARELGHLRAVAGRRAAPLVLERRARLLELGLGLAARLEASGPLPFAGRRRRNF